MGHRKTARILSRKGSAVEIHHTGTSTSERMRRSVGEELQSCTKEAVGEQILTPFELYTSLLEVANLVNQRPIGRIPNDPDDGSYVCPNDMLLGRATSHVPQGPFKETKNPRQRVEFVQKIVDSFWERWTRDVFPSLIPRKKWNAEKRNVQVDDFVIVQTPHAIRGNWNTGRIVNVYPGQDGKVRNVRVKTGTGEYDRPITKIVGCTPRGRLRVKMRNMPSSGWSVFR